MRTLSNVLGKGGALNDLVHYDGCEDKGRRAGGACGSWNAALGGLGGTGCVKGDGWVDEWTGSLKWVRWGGLGDRPDS
jgi:hypothetical protein